MNESRAEELQQRISAYTAHNAAADREFEHLHALLLDLDPEDRKSAPLLLDLAEAAGICEQARYGQLIQILAQAERVKATAKGGIIPWVATHLDTTKGRALAMANSAREIGAEPELAQILSSGQIGSDTVKMLARTSRATKTSSKDKTEALTEALEISLREGVTAANKHVRLLEEALDPGQAKKILDQQRARSFARFVEVDSGMVRIEALLDPARATTIRAAVDAYVSGCIRARQLDGIEIVAADVRSTEQLQAQAIARLGELFLIMSPTQHEISFTPQCLYHAAINVEEGQLAESIYGDLFPRDILAPIGDPAAHLIETIDGQPIYLDGKIIDTHPHARLASRWQRIALAFRDKKCAHKGCFRPPTHSLHAHHQNPYSEGGKTVMNNLISLCSEHHTLIHQRIHQDAARRQHG
jgi:hypothetical protein